LVIGDSLKAPREQKNLSQGDIEKRTGLIRVYVSWVENGHTVPALETLEKFAGAREVPMYSYFMTAKSHPNQMPRCRSRVMGSSVRDAKTLQNFRRLMSRADDGDEPQ